jgi:hypothetical protein
MPTRNVLDRSEQDSFSDLSGAGEDCQHTWRAGAIPIASPYSSSTSQRSTSSGEVAPAMGMKGLRTIGYKFLGFFSLYGYQ